MDAKLLTYREGIYEFNTERFIALSESEVDFSVVPIISVKPDQEIFAFQITLDIKNGEEKLLHYGFVVLMQIAGWIPLTSADMKSATGNETEKESGSKSDRIKELIFSRASSQINAACRAIVGFTIGAFAARIGGEISGNPLSFPEITSDSLVNALEFRVL